MDCAMQQAPSNTSLAFAAILRGKSRSLPDLERDGCDITIALDLLTTFRHMQDQNVAHRDRILEELEQ